MITDITYCDWMCPWKGCARNTMNLEGTPEEELEHISTAQFPDCIHYGKTDHMYVPQRRRRGDRK